MAALLESVGIDTAFITVPGHIFMAFSLGLSEEEAKQEFTHTDDFIFMEGRAWAPLEVTIIQQGFLKAFSTGAKQWRDAVRQEVAGFFPVHQAWEEFEPVGFTSGTLSLLFPDRERIIESYRANLDAFVSREIEAKIETLRQRLSRRDSAPVRNSLGILYGRYGLFDEAEKEFLAALRLDPDFYNTMYNLGNINFLQKEYPDALSWYQKAANLKPESPFVVAGLARTKFEMEQFQEAQDDYRQLAEIHPSLAEEYAYIGNTSNSIVRASAAMDKGKTFWELDEEAMNGAGE